MWNWFFTLSCRSIGLLLTHDIAPTKKETRMNNENESLHNVRESLSMQFYGIYCQTYLWFLIPCAEVSCYDEANQSRAENQKTTVRAKITLYASFNMPSPTLCMSARPILCYAPSESTPEVVLGSSDEPTSPLKPWLDSRMPSFPDPNMRCNPR